MCRLLTPQLEEVLKDFPLYSQDGKGKEAVCVAIFAIGSARWFILEGEHEEDDKLQVRQQPNFQPTPLKLLRDNRLKRFLERFEE